MIRNLRELAEQIKYTRKEVDDFLNDDLDNWGVFDSEVGYLPRNCARKGGIDDTRAVYTTLNGGLRTPLLYTDLTCRINTYGDSYTQCAQVSDAESWQEYLAGHLLEPVRNFGVGGQGAYHAYRLMERHEATDYAALCTILTIYDDDNYRSIDLQRWTRIDEVRRRKSPQDFPMIHANPWCHLRYNPSTSTFEEAENPCPTRESLYNMCDPEFIHNLLEHDFVTQIMLAKDGAEVYDIALLRGINESLGLSLGFGDPRNCRKAALSLLDQVAFRSSIFVSELWRKYCDDAGKKFIVALVYNAGIVRDAVIGKPRRDTILAEYLADSGMRFYDHLETHVREYKRLKCGDPDEYIRTFHIGHHSPRGNHLFAYGIRDTVVQMLDPKPFPYRE